MARGGKLPFAFALDTAHRKGPATIGSPALVSCGITDCLGNDDGDQQRPALLSLTVVVRREASPGSISRYVTGHLDP